MTAHDMYDEHGELIVPNGFDIEWDASAGYVIAT
jgi:hypothetical protein